MGRRKSTFEQMVEVFARLPWWVCLVLALLAYLILDAVVRNGTPVSRTRSVAEIGTLVQQQYLMTFARFGKVLLPLAFVLAAAVSLWGRLKRRGLGNAVETRGAAAFDTMSWREFEMAASEVFRRRGYTVREAHRGPDGGVDLTLQKDGRVTLAQCKHWRGRLVDVRVARELWGVVAARRAAGGALLSTGGFTRDARKFADEVGIDLLDGAALAALVRPTEAIVPPSAQEPVGCPTCGAPMVVRTARSGQYAGQQFLGCSSYPKCRGKRPLAADRR